MAKGIGLPNWNHAASPCLRSRLEFGVEATVDHLKRVEEAEQFLRHALNLPVDTNLRVRLLAQNRGAIGIMVALFSEACSHRIEVDKEYLEHVQNCEFHDVLERLGFREVQVHEFQSGRLSGFAAMR